MAHRSYYRFSQL